MEKCKKRKISEENKTLNDAWADSFAFTSNKSGLPICLICGEKRPTINGQISQDISTIHIKPLLKNILREKREKKLFRN